MEVMDDWEQLEMCEGAGQLELEPQGLQHTAEGHSRRPGLCRAPNPGCIPVVSVILTVHKHILIWLMARGAEH